MSLCMYHKYCVNKLSLTRENLVFQSQKYPKKGFFGLMGFITGPISTACYYYVRVMILSYHCVCIKSIVASPIQLPSSHCL